MNPLNVSWLLLKNYPMWDSGGQDPAPWDGGKVQTPPPQPAQPAQSAQPTYQSLTGTRCRHCGGAL